MGKLIMQLGFPGSSAGKESTCNVGDLGSIPGLGSSPGGGNGYALQYSGLENFEHYFASVAQLVKNPLEMWEIWVRSLGWEGPLEKGTATHSSILGLPLWLS